MSVLDRLHQLLPPSVFSAPPRLLFVGPGLALVAFQYISSCCSISHRLKAHSASGLSAAVHPSAALGCWEDDVLSAVAIDAIEVISGTGRRRGASCVVLSRFFAYGWDWRIFDP